MDLYLSFGATPLDAQTTYRLTGDSLKEAAKEA